MRSMWIFGLLFISLMGANGLNYFPKNFVVAKRNDDAFVTLPCGATSKGNEVQWTFRGEEMEYEDNVLKHGPNLRVNEVDGPVLGNYTCWSGGESASIYLLLMVEDDKELDSFLTCRANSYHCMFSCTWNDTTYEAVRLGLGPDCRKGGKSCPWVSSNEQDGRLQFELNHSLSPYAEESTMLTLTAEAIEGHSVLRKTKIFYLRDIIEPDSPQIVKCQEYEQHLSLTVHPPSSWSTPDSFFALEHEVEYMDSDEKIGRVSPSHIPKNIHKLKVRSRDPVVQSKWSQWTNWTNVQGGKRKLLKPQKGVIYCNPKMHSRNVDLCK
ncbi:interleukin-12 subunit beta [Phycodurus eques]|uniref:interleukin-12 subunit beta n=1 Tax=Phycodurus eques TaxID=693459 RepID=UPI002ACEF2AD|nr:interleukin-12 subunit beta [Phycodurus eques]